MNHFVIWNDNGDKTRNAYNCGYTEEISDKSEDEIRKSYEAHGCRIFGIDEISNKEERT